MSQNVWTSKMLTAFLLLVGFSTSDAAQLWRVRTQIIGRTNAHKEAADPPRARKLKCADSQYGHRRTFGEHHRVSAWSSESGRPTL